MLVVIQKTRVAALLVFFNEDIYYGRGGRNMGGHNRSKPQGIRSCQEKKNVRTPS